MRRVLKWYGLICGLALLQTSTDQGGKHAEAIRDLSVAPIARIGLSLASAHRPGGDGQNKCCEASDAAAFGMHGGPLA
jgi:hypothetical protein